VAGSPVVDIVAVVAGNAYPVAVGYSILHIVVVVVVVVVVGMVADTVDQLGDYCNNRWLGHRMLAVVRMDRLVEDRSCAASILAIYLTSWRGFTHIFGRHCMTLVCDFVGYGTQGEAASGGVVRLRKRIWSQK